MCVSLVLPHVEFRTKSLSFQPEEPIPSIPSRIRTAVLEIAEVCLLLRSLLHIHERTSVVRQTLSRDARTLPIRWDLRQESLGARWRRKAAWRCVRPGILLHLTQPVMHTLT